MLRVLLRPFRRLRDEIRVLLFKADMDLENETDDEYDARQW